MMKNNQIWMNIVAKAWADEDYKARLLNDPSTVLTQEGMTLPEGKSVKIVEATADETLFVLPKPMDSIHSEDLEERLAAIMIF